MCYEKNFNHITYVLVKNVYPESNYEETKDTSRL